MLPGVIGGISLILAFFAFQSLPINWAGLLLILFGVALLIAEIKIASHGVLTLIAASPLRSGTYTLEIDFSNDFNTRADSFYRLETGGHSYTFTQFEADAAREEIGRAHV